MSAATPNKMPARHSAAYHLVRGKTKRTAIPASAVASAGISSIQEELNSRNPGDAINSAVANVPVSSPLVRRMMMKTQMSNTAANAVVTNRWPQNGRSQVLDYLGDKKGVQRGLIIPHLAVELMAVEAQGCLGQFEPFIRANLHCGSQRDLTLKEEKRGK